MRFLQDWNARRLWCMPCDLLFGLSLRCKKVHHTNTDLEPELLGLSLDCQPETSWGRCTCTFSQMRWPDDQGIVQPHISASRQAKVSASLPTDIMSRADNSPCVTLKRIPTLCCELQSYISPTNLHCKALAARSP